jgi:histidine triad (HIT) family protein
MASQLEKGCIFCAIAAGAIASFKVYANDRLYAFLDIHPIRPGHLQIVPRDHYPYFDDLPPDLAVEILLLGQRLAPVLKDIYNAPRIGFAFTGGDVPHAHAHVVPLYDNYDITSRAYIVEEQVTFRRPPTPPAGELEETARRIRDALAES